MRPMTMKRGRARGRPVGGSDAIVDAILATTLTHLEERGFEDLSVEEIARAAGVNKTSVYRRWPSKADLVLAAVGSVSDAEPPFVESGELRSDLVRLLEAKAASLATPLGQNMGRALMALDGKARRESNEAFLKERPSVPRAVLARAIARGDLPPDADPDFLDELLAGPILRRILMRNEPVDTAYVTRVVDHVLAAARARPAGPARS
jgi:AcrR family transcriptional regulator